VEGSPESGECHLIQLWSPGGGDRLCLERADRRVLITPELLDAVADGQHEQISLRPPEPIPAGYARFRYHGAVLRIEADGRTVVYRVGEYLPDRRCYVAEWPD
jgi:hypothetical protein